ncbi:MAG: M28 family peptidase [candidate division Zixibacteria bacterium]|nr:M28 family peptidase [candidate division Zixibacteria bacterium]
MYKPYIFVLLFVVGLTGVVGGTDLYKVLVTCPEDALRLNEARVEPVAPIFGGYLILADPAVQAGLEGAGVKTTLISSGISIEELALNLRQDTKNVDEFQMVYEEDAFRLYRVDRSLWETGTDLSVMPVKNENLKIQFQPSPVFDKSRLDGIDLEGLIAQVSQDSLYAYSSTLETFGYRLTGTSSNHLSRDWLVGKFVSFGYDSIVIDSFTASVSGTTTQCQNVLAIKVGTVLPEHYIVVGAHRDASSGSPGADDNGSGTVAVLEIARILKNIDTDMTIVFALFDSEEQGLNGSYHYADEAAARGDSIGYMFNMDMIANEGNSTQAKLYFGSVMTYTMLCRNLADSLLGISASLWGSSSSSDHYPFWQNGYQTTFLQEYIFSSVYHSYRDSTTHMDFPYFTKMVKVGLATAYAVNEAYAFDRRMRFTYPDGVPSELDPGLSASFPVVVSGLHDVVPVPGSGRLYYSINNGAYAETSMSELFPNQYQATLPALNCGDGISFYFSVEDTGGGIFNNPNPANPFMAVTMTADTVVFFDDFEQDLGWTPTGLWERGSPTGNGGFTGNPDPVGGYNSSNCYGYNLAGDYTNNMPETHLTSPAIDCHMLSEVRLTFWRWLGVGNMLFDHAFLRVSTDGITWTTIWQNTTAATDDGSWTWREFDLSAIAAGQPTVYLRWTMGPTDQGGTYCGWNIDDVHVGGSFCDTELRILTASLPDWTAGHPYSQQLIASGETGPYTWTDKFGTLAGTGLSLSTDGLLSGVPLSPGPISFTVQAMDQLAGVRERAYDFTINPALAITTSSLPDAFVRVPYSYQLTSSGGTGDVNWTDRDGVLVGTGLTLSGSGLLAGRPLSVGQVDLTARAADAVGASAEQLIPLAMELLYVCGDANGDTKVNVGDAVYIITYVFRGGPAPDPMGAGDAYCDGKINVGDAVYLISYIFRSGPMPCCP